MHVYFSLQVKYKQRFQVESVNAHSQNSSKTTYRLPKLLRCFAELVCKFSHKVMDPDITVLL